MKDIEDCKKCEWAHKQPGIIFCPFHRCMKELEERRQEAARKLQMIYDKESDR